MTGSSLGLQRFDQGERCRRLVGVLECRIVDEVGIGEHVVRGVLALDQHAFAGPAAISGVDVLIHCSSAGAAHGMASR